MTPCFLASQEDGWIPLAHTHEEVQQRLLNNLSNHRALAVDVFWERGLQDLNAKTERSIPYSRKLEKYFNAFNDIFFFGAVTDDLCKLTFVKAGWRRWNRNQSGDCDEGFTTDHRRSQISHRSRPLTKVYIYERLDQDDEAMLLHKCLEILLHEMIHAFIHIYICLCPSCEVQTARLEGSGGHGVTWHLLADAMEDFTARFLGLELDLGRGDAAYELEEEISRPAATNFGVDRMAEEGTEDDTIDGTSSEALTDIPEYVAEEEISDLMYQS
jgi:hypothetical protein